MILPLSLIFRHLLVSPYTPSFLPTAVSTPTSLGGGALRYQEGSTWCRYILLCILGTIWPWISVTPRTDVTRKKYKTMPRFSDLRYDEYPPAPKPLNSCVDTIRCRRVVPLHCSDNRLNGLWLGLPPTCQQPENEADPVIWPRFTLVSMAPANQDIHLIGNRRMGGDSTHNFAYLSYTSHLGATTIKDHI